MSFIKPGSIQALIAFDQQAKAEKGFRFLFGVDEAGRGPLAGPVVAAAVCLKDQAFSVVVGDSKKLSAARREQAFHQIHERAYVGVGLMSETVIDAVNILRASHLAMAAAVRDLVSHLPAALKEAAGFGSTVKVLVDGNSFTAAVPYKVETVIGGDGKSLAVACASIIAKVTRDRIVDIYDIIYPQYGFRKHKGYPTAEHCAAIARHGLSPIHRKTFRSTRSAS
ncbi:MAG: ribonuclease HII [Candidatus Omnitrophica bacterium]|nr:ribonuclease HII [Candidatus Omnitrophota bacterium]